MFIKARVEGWKIQAELEKEAEVSVLLCARAGSNEMHFLDWERKVL